jgi:hypothetical protein
VPAVAASEPAPPPEPGTPEAETAAFSRRVERALREVLKAPEFRQTDREIYWRRRARAAHGAADGDSEEVHFLSFPEAPPAVWRTALALSAVAAGLLVLRWRGAWAKSGRAAGAEPRAPGRTEAPPTLVGLDVRAASLPADVPEEAWRLWQAGEPEAALALLYRGALASLMAGGGLRFEPSWTEGDCLREVRRQAGAESAVGGAAGGPGWLESADFFARLTGTWQAAAYAGRVPDASVARGLCDGWRRCLGARGATATAATVAGPRTGGGGAAT